eukprot:gene26940-32552_t
MEVLNWAQQREGDSLRNAIVISDLQDSFFDECSFVSDVLQWVIMCCTTPEVANATRDSFRPFRDLFEYYIIGAAQKKELCLKKNTLQKKEASWILSLTTLLLSSTGLDFFDNSGKPLQFTRHPDSSASPHESAAVTVNAGPETYVEPPSFPSKAMCLLHIRCSAKDTENKDKYVYCGYTTLTQSSGYGKTRMVKELASEHVLIYIWLRTGEGWPSRSTGIADYIMHYVASFDNWFNLLLALLLFLDDDNESKGFFPDTSFQLSCYRRLGQIICQTCDGSRTIQRTGKLGRWLHEDGDKRVVVCLDEASALLDASNNSSHSKFAEFRRGIRMLQKPDKEPVVDVLVKRVFGIPVDTDSSITNVLPVKDQDPSGRLSEQGYRLCRPYFLFPLEIPNLVRAEVADSLEVRCSILVRFIASNRLAPDIEIVWRPADMLLHSRPVFACCTLSLLKDNIHVPVYVLGRVFSSCVDFAMTKLQGGSSITPMSQKAYVHLAMLACRCNVFVVANPVRTELLLRLYMASCLNILEDRSDIAILYPSEPCLVAGAMSFMRREPEGMVAILSSLYDMFYNKNLLSFNGGVGESGEFLAQVVLFMIFDRAWQQKGAETTFETQRARLAYYSFKSAEADAQQEPVESALSYLDSLGWRPLPLLWMLRLMYEPSEYAEILKTFSSSVALCVFKISCNSGVGARAFCVGSGEVGANLVIPVMLPHRKGVPMDIRDEQTYQMSAWLVQVKNWRTAVPAKALLEVLTAHPLIAGLVRHQVPFLLLVWNVQAHMSQPQKGCTSHAVGWAQVEGEGEDARIQISIQKTHEQKKKAPAASEHAQSQPASSSTEKPSAAFLMLLKAGLGTASDRNSSTKVSKVIPALSERELEMLDKFRVRYPGGARGYLEDVSSVLLQQQE